MNINIGIELELELELESQIRETIYLCDENLNRITTETGDYLIL